MRRLGQLSEVRHGVDLSARRWRKEWGSEKCRTMPLHKNIEIEGVKL
jgi:hypothetical protein